MFGIRDGNGNFAARNALIKREKIHSDLARLVRRIVAGDRADMTVIAESATVSGRTKMRPRPVAMQPNRGRRSRYITPPRIRHG